MTFFLHDNNKNHQLRTNLSNVCKNLYGVADVLVDVQPGGRGTRIFLGVRPGCGQELRDS